MKLFAKTKNVPSNVLTENSAFVALVQLTRDNENSVARVIRGLLQKSSPERMVLVERLATEFEAGGADRDLVEALRFLKHDEVARQLKALTD